MVYFSLVFPLLLLWATTAISLLSSIFEESLFSVSELSKSIPLVWFIGVLLLPFRNLKVDYY